MKALRFSLFALVMQFGMILGDVALENPAWTNVKEYEHICKYICTLYISTVVVPTILLSSLLKL